MPREYLTEVCLLETSVQAPKFLGLAPSPIYNNYGSLKYGARAPTPVSYDYGSTNYGARAPSPVSYDYGSINHGEPPPPASSLRSTEITDLRLDLNVQDRSCKGNEIFYDYTVSTIFDLQALKIKLTYKYPLKIK